MTKHQALFINGEWVSGYGALFSSKNPANQDTIWEAEGAAKSDVGRAIKAAKIAESRWASTPIQEKIAIIETFGTLIDQKKDELAEAISKETGKTLWDAKGEVAAVLGKIPLSIQAYQERCNEKELSLPMGTSYTRHKPIGTLVVLGPFNFPAHLPNGHIVPALLAGNCIVFKPSEHTPLVAELMVKTWEEAKLPNGVLNLLPGASQVGKWIVEQPDINGVLFTGSYITGQALAKQFAETPEKILAMEMGGNNPLVVGTVSNLPSVIYQIIQSAFLTSGQRCTCARRLIIQEGELGDALIKQLSTAIQTIVVGSYQDTPEPFMGPVISEETALHLLMKQASMQSKGGNSLVPLTQLEPGTGLVSPGLIDVTKIKNRTDEELFGPLLQLIRVPNFEATINEANRTSYGLAAGLLSDSEEEYTHFYQNVQAGVINWNVPLTGASSAAPFGGIGHSGNHRPSGYFASDYCSYPTASIESKALTVPEKFPPGISLEVNP